MANARRQWSGVIEDLPTSILDTRVQELPKSVIDKLGLMLYNDGRGDAGNWEGLAEELGITSNAELEAIQRRALVERAFPGCRLLNDWMAGEGKTVYVLLQALKAQRRDDCLEYLVQKCQGRHSMHLHIKIEFEGGHHEFKSVSTEKDASLASSLENILHYLPNYIITGPDQSIGWSTPAQLLKGKQLSLKKVEESDATRHTVYGIPMHHVGVPTPHPSAQCSDFNHLDLQENEHQLTNLKGDAHYELCYNIPVSTHAMAANIPSTPALTQAVTLNNLSRGKPIHTRIPSETCTTAPTNYGNSVTNLKHKLASCESHCDDAIVTSQWQTAQWPSLPMDESLLKHVTRETQQTIQKEVQQSSFTDDTSLKQPVVRPQYNVTTNQNKMCIKEHFVKQNSTTGTMSVRQFLTENTTYANPSSTADLSSMTSLKPNMLTINPPKVACASVNKTACLSSSRLVSKNPNKDSSFLQSGSNASAVLKFQPVPSVVPNPSAVLKYQPSTSVVPSASVVIKAQPVPPVVPSSQPIPFAVLRSQTSMSTSTSDVCTPSSSTPVNSSAYIDLNHPVVSVISRRCVPPSIPVDYQHPQPDTVLPTRPCTVCNPDINVSASSYSDFGTENLDGHTDLTGEPRLTDMDVSEPSDNDTERVKKVPECVIQQSVDGYFGFADINNDNCFEGASQFDVFNNEVPFTNLNVGNHILDASYDLNNLESESSSMEFKNVDASLNLVNSKSAPLMICESPNGYFGFAEPMESEQYSCSLGSNQSDSVLTNRIIYGCLDSGVENSLPITRQDDEHIATQGTPPNKKVTWQLTYSRIETGIDEDDLDYIDMSGTELQRTELDESTSSLSHLYSTGSINDEAGSPYGYTYIPIDDTESMKPRSMSLPQVRPPLPLKRRANSSPIFGRNASKAEMNEIPGWCPDETELTIKRTMDKFINEDGNFIVWRMRKTQKFIISVSHLREIRHYVIHEKRVNNEVHYYIFPAGKETPDVAELITYYQREGLKGPDPHLTGSRGKKWQKFSHIQLKTPLRVKNVTTVVRKDK